MTQSNDTRTARFHALVTARLQELEADIERGTEGTATVALDQQSIGRLSRQDALLNQAMSQAQQTRRKHDIMRLKAALKRMEEDEFGYCDDCGDPIPDKRLELDPALTRCVSCASA